MRRIFLAIIAFGLCFNSFAQDTKNPPNWNKIEFEVSNGSSPFYYPRLMERYVVGDTTLTFDEYYHLYYGFVFQPAYTPLLHYPETDSLDNLFSRRTAISYDTFVRASQFANALVTKSPFSLRDINLLAYTLENLDQREAAAREMRKVSMLQKVIESTGTGLEEKSPYYIILPTNGDDIVALRGLTQIKTIICGRFVEFIQVARVSDELKKFKGLYFEFSQVYKRSSEYLEGAEQPKRRMEINNTRPWELKKY